MHVIVRKSKEQGNEQLRTFRRFRDVDERTGDDALGKRGQAVLGNTKDGLKVGRGSVELGEVIEEDV
jgi:hypothetical protein